MTTLPADLERVLAQREKSLAEPFGTYAEFELYETMSANLVSQHGPALRSALEDRARLDWLGEIGAERRVYQCQVTDDGRQGKWICDGGGDAPVATGETLRAAIDAARAQEAGK